MSSPEEQNDASSWDLLADELGLEPFPTQKEEAPTPNPYSEVGDIPEAAVVEVNTLVDGTLDVVVETKGPSIVEVIVPPPLPKPPVTKSLALEDRLLSEEADSGFGAGLDLPPVEPDSTPHPTKFVALVTPLPEESEPIAEPETEPEVETDTEADLDTDPQTEVELEAEPEPEAEKGGKKKRRRRRKKGGAVEEEPTVTFAEEDDAIPAEGESDVETADAPEVLDEEEETIIPSAIDEEMEAEISQPTPQWTVMSWVDLIATLHRPER